MRYTLASLIILVPSNAFAQWDAGADVNSIPESEPAQWDRDVGEPDWDTLVRKESGHFCGDGRVNNFDGERCEGRDLDGESCESLGYVGGTLGREEWLCVFDTSGCLGAVCGDGRVDDGEECDRDYSELCEYGEPSTDVCIGCELVPCIEQFCGDGTVQAVEGGEECDPAGTPDGSVNCADVWIRSISGPAYPSPDGSCLDDCTTTCAYCGDGEVQEEFESCEVGMTSKDVCLDGFGVDAFAICRGCEWDTTPCERAADPSDDDPGDSGDGGTSGEMTSRSNGGCASSHSSTFPPFGLLALILGLAVRRREDEPSHSR